MSKKNIHLSELIGNKNIRTQLMIANGAARLHNKAMGHILFSGLAGCGKTSSAKAVANLSGAPLFETSAESIKTAEDLAKLFSKFPSEGYNDLGEIVGTITPPIVFIDEAHRLSLKTEEMLGIAMEDFTHSFTQGKGRNKGVVTTWVPRFTVICATTKEGELSKPFRDRFKFNFVFSSYALDESIDIANLHASKKGIKIDGDAVEIIARRSRGTPRLIVKHLDTVHDVMVYMEKEQVTATLTKAQFELMEVDALGLSATDIAILKDLHTADTPQGIDSLAVKTNLDPKTITEVSEPYLIRLGFIERTKGGRVITDSGSAHLVKHGHVKAPAVEVGTSRVIKHS